MAGKFDFLALYETLIRDEHLSKRFYPKPFLAHGRVIALTIKDRDKHVWHFRDSIACCREASRASASPSSPPTGS